MKHDGVVEGGTGAVIRPVEPVKPEDAGFEDYGFRKSFRIDRTARKKVLITGAGSYIGGSFVKYCREHYPDIETDVLDMRGDGWKNFDFSGYDSVFHVAGIAHADAGHASKEEQENDYRVNTDLAYAAAAGKFLRQQQVACGQGDKGAWGGHIRRRGSQVSDDLRKRKQGFPVLAKLARTAPVFPHSMRGWITRKWG